MGGVEEGSPSDNLYVSNLPLNASEELVRDIFGKTVVSCNILPSTPGEGSCAALVRVVGVTEALAMKAALDGQIIPGFTEPIRIRFADNGGQDQNQYGKAAGKGKSSASSPYNAPNGNQTPGDKLYIKGLPPGVDDKWITEQFADYGANVVQCRVLPANREGESWHALVRFATIEQAETVKKHFDGATIEGQVGGKPIEIDYAELAGIAGISRQQPPVQQVQPMQQQVGQEVADAGKGPDNVPNNTQSSNQQEVMQKMLDVMKSMMQQKGYQVNQSGGKGGSVTAGKVQIAPAKGGGKWKEPFSVTRRLIKHCQDMKILPGSDVSDDDNCLFISGLPLDTQDVHLYKMCSPFGAITPTGVRALKNPDGTCKGVGFINYVDPYPVELAAEMLNGFEFSDGSKLRVAIKSVKKE